MDAPAQTAYTLRPLSIGEIFDRAVTMYVRNFVPFTLMMLTLLAPLGVVRFYFMPDNTTYAQILAGAGRGGTALPPGFWQFYGGLMGVGLVTILLLPFVTNAVAVGVAAIYSGRSISYGASFSAVLKRWAPLLGTALLNVMMVMGIYVFSIVVLVIFAGIGMAFVSLALPVAVIIFIIAGLAFLAVIVFLVMMILAYSFSLYASTIENAGVIDAIGKGYSRIFSRGEFKKAFLMALAFIGINIGVLVVAGSVALLAELGLKSSALMITIETAINSAFYAFSTILIAVYYYDVRTRAEGLDLEVDLSKLTTTS